MNEQNNQKVAFCMYCGTKHTLGDKFCGKCGKKIESAVPLTQESQNQLLYQKAIGLLQAQKFDEALSIFKKLEDYNDSKEKAQICIAAKENAKKESLYSYAVSLLNANKVSEADIKNTIVALKSIENYRNTKEVIAKLEELLEKCLESQRVAQEAALKRQYFAATSHFKAGAFDEAIKIFSSLGDYSDSKDQIKKCLEAKETARKQSIYDGSVCVLNASNPTEEALKAAINNLKSISDFKDSNEQVTRVEARLEKWYADRDAALEARRIYLANVKARRKKIAIISIMAIIIVSIIVAGIIFATHPYEIKYDLKGGMFEGENNTSYTFITEEFTITNPIKEGYTFVGWTGTDVETPVKNLTVPQWSAGNKEFIANWQANDYIVEFLPNGGSMDTTSMVVTFDKNVQLPYPVKTGYNFLGWYNGDTKVENGAWKIPSNITLSSQWEAIQYIVTLDANGGIPSNTSIIATYDQEFTLPTPTRTGYGFLGWYNEDTLIESGIWNIPSDLTLKAQWLANSNTIILDAKGGTVSSAYITATYDQEFTLPTPTRTGYTFEGWFNGDTQYFSGTWNELNDVTLVAKWTANTYNITYTDTTENRGYVTVTFDYKYTDSTPFSVTLTNGETLEYPEIPTLSGYAFTGWYTDVDCSTKYSFTGEITEDITLYAGWVSVSYTALSPESSNDVYLYSSSTYYSFVPLESGYVTISIGKKGYLNCPSTGDSGYNSISIYCTAGSVYNFYVESYYGYTGSSYTGDTTLTLSSTIPTSTATASCRSVSEYVYEAGVNYSTTIVYDSLLTLPSPTRTGYTFLGWYNGDTKVENGTWTTPSSVTLSPRWEANQNTITLDANGGTVSSTSINVTYDQAFTLPTPTRTGYTFEGWFNVTTQYFDGTWNELDDVTLTALWTVNTYDVTFSDIMEVMGLYEYAEGSSIYTSVEFDSEFTLPSPSRLGYAFLGWYNGSTPVTDGVWDIDSDVVLTPMWEERPNTITLDPNGTTLDETSISIVYGEYLTLPTPEKTGYTFEGWFCDGVEYTSGDWLGLSDITLVAEWTPNTYNITYSEIIETRENVTVTFDYNYTDSIPYSVTLTNGETLEYPNIPTRSDYIFAGWYTDADCTSIFAFNETITEDITLYAKWIYVSSYTGILSIGGNTGSTYFTSTIKYYPFVPLVDQTITLYTSHSSGDPVIYLYDSNKNTLDSDDDSYGSRDSYITYSVTAGTLYYAGFGAYSSGYGYMYLSGIETPTSTATASCGTVTGYVYDELSSVFATIEYDAMLTLPTPVRPEYTFLGWFDGDTKIESGIWNYDYDVVLTPKWRELDYYEVTLDDINWNWGVAEVTFDYNYSGSTSTVITVNNNDYLEYPEIPTREGYYFTGWYYDSECRVECDFTYPLVYQSEIILYAGWAIDYVSMYSVYSWYSNGDYLYSADISDSQTAEYTVEALMPLTVTFDYKTSSEQNYDILYIQKNGETLVSCSGSTSYTSYSVELQKGDKLSFIYRKDGSASNGSDCAYIDNLTYTPNLPTSNSTLVLIIDMVSFVYEEGNQLTAEIAYGEEIEFPEPIREGYVFLGWYNGDTKVENGIWTIEEDVVLTPKWEPIS